MMNVEKPRLTLTEQYLVHRRRTRRLIYIIVLLVMSAVLFWRFFAGGAEKFSDIREHFKYGSIGSETPAETDGKHMPLQGGHLPLRLWQVLPHAFPEYLPKDRIGNGYERFGFVFEEGRDRPVGFSKRRYAGIDLLGLNCAVCHVGSVRTSDGRQIVLGAPSNTVELLSYFRFLFRCAEDQRFSDRFLLPEIAEQGRIGIVERAVLRRAIPKAREGILQSRYYLRYLEEDFGLKDTNGTPLYSDFGPGRVDTFNAVKAIRLKRDMSNEKWVGTNDFPSIWMQEIRDGVLAHWDGNTSSVMERNLSAALGVGAEPDTIDLPSIQRVHRWIGSLQPPKFPFPIDNVKTKRGRAHYINKCAACHGLLKDDALGWSASNWDARRVGEVIPIGEINTDPHRLNSFSQELATQTREIGKGKPWQFRHFRKTDGYVNMPLDGIWARAPYLHNGSVPTMWHLLLPEGQRPTEFNRGSDVYLEQEMGFAYSGEAARTGFHFDSGRAGNSPSGHSGPKYGTDLTDEEKWELVEYLKTL